MGLDHAASVEAAGQRALRVEHTAGTAATGNRLVILMTRIAKSEVVDRQLARPHDAERADDGVGDAGRGFDIARHHRCRRARVQHRALGDDDLQRFQAASVQRYVVIDQYAKHIEHRRHAYRCRRVEVVALLRRSAGEIDLGAAVFCIDANRHLNLRAVVQRKGKFDRIQIPIAFVARSASV